MQLVSYKKHFGLSMLLILSAITFVPAAQALPTALNKTIVYSAFFTALACFLRLTTKETQPKRVYPESDSFTDIAWFTFDELLVGQMEKGDRPSKVMISQENQGELTIEYSKIPARGLSGITYSMMKPVILPAIALATIFNNDIIKKSGESWANVSKFAASPVEAAKNSFHAGANPHAA